MTSKPKFYTRIEVIGEYGREFVSYASYEAVEQDNGKTLKLIKRGEGQ